MKVRVPFLSLWKFLAVFLVVGFLAVYFRTYGVHGGLFLSFRSSTSIARDLVDRAMQIQIQKAIEKSGSKILAEDRERLVRLQMEKIKQENREQYDGAVRNAATGIEEKRHKRQRYLLEADPYHYLYQTERLLETGRIADIKKDGEYFQPLMRAPHGHWEEYSLHPYVGLWCYRVLHAFDRGISLTEAVAYVPLFLTLLVLLAFGIFGNVLGLPLAATAIGMAIIALSPINMQRSALGWFDTDPYNYLFPVLILTCVFGGLQHKKWGASGAILAAFFTGLYALFWTGWPFILVLVLAGLISGLLPLWAIQRSNPPGIVKEALRFLGIYGIAACVFLAIFLTPGGLLNSIRTGWDALNKFALAEWDMWPNLFLTVGEANGIGLKKLIFLTANYFTFGLALVGLLLEGWEALKQKDVSTRFRFVFFSVFSIPVLLMSLKTERFSLLFVLPLAIFAAFGVARLLQVSAACGEGEWSGPAFLKKRTSRKRAALALILLVVSPMTFITAHVVAGEIKPIMDDVWNDALLELRAKTPKNAVIISWWPPGYFVTGVAHRAVVADGGTQQFHENYWIAQALMADDEREAAGIIRMLDLGGNDAMDLLLKWGMEVGDAADLLLKIVKMGRSEAFALLPAFMTPEQKNELLDKTHDRSRMPPAYVLIYNDLIDQNLAVSVVARWDFRKAKALGEQKRQHAHGGIFGILGADAGRNYVHELLDISGTMLKYATISPLAKREGDQLTFQNGVCVDLTAKNAWVGISTKGAPANPSSFFYFGQGKLVERKYQGNVPDISVLFFEDAGAYYAVLADARLIRSLLFRLYYLKGQGLTLFKPLLEKGSLAGGTVVQVFELVREKLPT